MTCSTGYYTDKDNKLCVLNCNKDGQLNDEITHTCVNYCDFRTSVLFAERRQCLKECPDNYYKEIQNN